MISGVPHDVDRSLGGRSGSEWISRILTPDMICAGVVFMTVIFGSLWMAPEIFNGTIYAAVQADTSGGDVMRQVAFLSLFALAVGSRFVMSGFLSLFWIPATMVPVLGWCWLSLLWAINPGIAVRRIAFTTVVIITLACCVQVLSYRRVITALTAGFAVLLICDLLAVGFLPYGVHRSDEIDKALVGAWRGLQNDKNTAGGFIAISLILFVHETIRLRSRVTGVGLLVLSLVFLFFSKSKTSIGLVLAALSIGYLVQLCFLRPQVRKVVFLLLGGIVVPACIAGWDHIYTVLYDFMLDPDSLTGRVQIWPIILEYAADNPLLGSGYGSFWGLNNGSPILQYTSTWVAGIYQAHNGYLDMLAQTGGVGLAFMLIGLVFTPLYQLLFTPLEAGVSRPLLCSILTFGWLRDSMETSLLDRAESVWPIMVIAFCLLAKYIRPVRASSATSS